MDLIKKCSFKKLLTITVLTFTLLAASTGICFSKINTGGIIFVMEESVLKISTFSNDESLVQIILINTATRETYELPVCVSNKCEYNLEFLNAGEYLLELKTNNETVSQAVKITK